MMLGDMLAAARRSTGDVERRLQGADPALAARAMTAAEAEGQGLADFVRAAVAEFGRFATEEDWATLVSRLRDNTDPGTTCLVAMTEWRLAGEFP